MSNLISSQSRARREDSPRDADPEQGASLAGLSAPASFRRQKSKRGGFPDLDDFFSVSTFQGLRTLYAEKGGLKFKSDDEFISRVYMDWDRVSLKALRLYAASEPEMGIPKRVVEVDGVTYHIWGVNHDRMDKECAYRQLVAEETKRCGKVFYEQVLKSVLSAPEGSVEIPDHSVLSAAESMLVFGETAGGRLESVARIMKEKFGAKRLPDRESVVENTSAIKGSMIQYVGNAERPPCGDFPYELFPSFGPMYFQVESELRQTGRLLSILSGRSVFQAEFVRAANRDKVVHIWVGAAHVPEIEYFLRHPAEVQQAAAGKRRGRDQLESPGVAALRHTYFDLPREMLFSCIGKAMFLFAPWAYQYLQQAFDERLWWMRRGSWQDLD